MVYSVCVEVHYACPHDACNGGCEHGTVRIHIESVYNSSHWIIVCVCVCVCGGGELGDF